MSNPDRFVVVKPRDEAEVFERVGDHKPEERPHRGRPRPPDHGENIGDERRALLSSRPRGRRWRDLAKLDDKLDGLQRRLVDAGRNLQAAEQAVQAAPATDARTLAEWLSNGERGKRPAATVEDRERERDAARLIVEALQLEVDRALEERREHIERHRDRMVKDGLRDVEDAQERLAAHISQLPELRETLLAARDNLRWVASFPEQAEGFGFPTALALGLRAPVKETLGTTARVEYRGMVAALEADAAALAEQLGPTVKERLGLAPRPTPEDRAMWWDDADAVAWRKEEVERARRLAEWSTDPDRLAAEVRDDRT
jgi:vacuolar-type H+-ATPase subunit H